MVLQLTEQQLDQISAAGEKPVEIHDPRLGRHYVLVSQDEYRRIRELLEDERDQAAIREMALRGAVARNVKDGPEESW